MSNFLERSFAGNISGWNGDYFLLVEATSPKEDSTDKAMQHMNVYLCLHKR